MDDMRSLRGQVAIVTGAAQGIGLAIAGQLAKQGAHVAMLDLDTGLNEAGADAIRRADGAATAFDCDVAQSASVDETWARISDRLGVPGVVVNNAAITRPAMLHKMSDADWDAVLRVNLTASFYTIRASARVMIPQRSGAIINISALAALRGALGQINYVSAKAGLVGMTKAAARELAKHGIRVNAVTPGVVRTRMSSTILTDERFRDKYVQEIPLGRVAEPDDIAQVVAFLACGESSYLTGQVINASGGTYM
jgi:3-oxoacyl-[acyl-carrier protein] reductase